MKEQKRHKNEKAEFQAPLLSKDTMVKRNIIQKVLDAVKLGNCTENQMWECNRAVWDLLELFAYGPDSDTPYLVVPDNCMVREEKGGVRIYLLDFVDALWGARKVEPREDSR